MEASSVPFSLIVNDELPDNEEGVEGVDLSTEDFVDKLWLLAITLQKQGVRVSRTRQMPWRKLSLIPSCGSCSVTLPTGVSTNLKAARDLLDI